MQPGDIVFIPLIIESSTILVKVRRRRQAIHKRYDMYDGIEYHAYVENFPGMNSAATSFEAAIVNVLESIRYKLYGISRSA